MMSRKGMKAADIAAESNARRVKFLSLYRSGMRLVDVAKQFGVSAVRARQIIYEAERREKYPRRYARPWWEGLTNGCVAYLKHHGFNSRDDCLLLCSENLNMKGCKVIDPRFSDPSESGWHGRGTLSFSRVNEVREWLGVAQLVFRYAASPDQIARAISLLVHSGYEVTKKGVKR
jgi:hypothetical protein